MKAFTYERANSLAQAAAASAKPGAKLIAGGTNLLDLMKLEVETPSRIVDISRLPLDKIEDTAEGGLRIGAMVRNSDLAADRRVRERYGVSVGRCCQEPARSCATKPPPAATSCSGRAAPISTM
jgi:xanthine dehydrogenase YagS FAD-binding subunit